MNGALKPIKWQIRLATGDTIVQSGDVNKEISPLDYFFHSFPEEQTLLCIRLTNIQLQKKNRNVMTREEFYKLLGLLILMTRFEFTRRSSLWSRTTSSKFIPAPMIGLSSGMSRNRFDELWSCLRWSEQPDERPEEMNHAEYMWRLVDDMVDIFNRHRSDNFLPAEWICVDESISRWYGLGGQWINIGLPMYVTIDRKPESGCEIQNAACGVSGVMLRLLLVKSEEHSELHTQENEEGIAHGTQILKYLTLPWANSNRGVCADSYFASVSSAEELMNIGLRFIGVVKTATKKYPMRYLSGKEMLDGRGQCIGVVNYNDDTDLPYLLAYSWMDRERRYFISTASSLCPGTPYQRVRWRQQEQIDSVDLDDMTLDEADAVRENLTVPQPKASEIYYNTCAAIDQHNRHRQDTLCLEKKIETKTWDKRVTTSLFGMYVVDSWLMYKGATTDSLQPDPLLNQQEFYCALAEELIVRGNQRRMRNASKRQGIVNTNQNATTDENSTVTCPLITLPKMKKRRTGNITTHRSQGRCKVCYKGRPTTICLFCHHQLNETNYLCNPKTGRDCAARHCQEYHM